MPSDTLLEIK